MNYTENVIVPERTLLVSLDTGEYDAEESLRELWELAKSGGAEPIATMMQKRPSPETATCVGSGMVEEIRNFCENNEIELIIFDRELTPTQIRNLENATDVRVVDRTMLILDIFAQRAQSRAGKVQVEAAQLKYLLPRLTCKGTALSRLGGGIGLRGRAHGERGSLGLARLGTRFVFDRRSSHRSSRRQSLSLLALETLLLGTLALFPLCRSKAFTLGSLGSAPGLAGLLLGYPPLLAGLGLGGTQTLLLRSRFGAQALLLGPQKLLGLARLLLLLHFRELLRQLFLLAIAAPQLLLRRPHGIAAGPRHVLLVDARNLGRVAGLGCRRRHVTGVHQPLEAG